MVVGSRYRRYPYPPCHHSDSITPLSLSGDVTKIGAVSLMLRCTNCGHLNTTVDRQTVFCPNCGASYPAGDLAHAAGASTSATLLDALPSVGVTDRSVNDASSSQRPTRQSRMNLTNGILVGLIVGLVLASSIIGVVIVSLVSHTKAVAMTVTATPLPHGQLAVYHDPRGQFVVGYSTAWTVRREAQALATTGEAITVTSFTAPLPSHAAFTVEVGLHTLVVHDINARIVAAGGMNVTMQPEPLAPVTFRAILWQRHIGTFSDATGRVYQVVGLFSTQITASYLVILTAPQAQFLVADQTFFQPMMQSLRAPKVGE